MNGRRHIIRIISLNFMPLNNDKLLTDARYPWAKTLVVGELIDNGDVYGEEFGITFTRMLEKYIDECDDMTQMEVIRSARHLLAMINEEDICDE